MQDGFVCTTLAIELRLADRCGGNVLAAGYYLRLSSGSPCFGDRGGQANVSCFCGETDVRLKAKGAVLAGVLVATSSPRIIALALDNCTTFGANPHRTSCI